MIWGAEQLFITRPYDGNKVGSLSQSRCAPPAFAEHQNIINKMSTLRQFEQFNHLKGVSKNIDHCKKHRKN